MNVLIRSLETREYSDVSIVNNNDHFRFQGQHCKGKRKINAINASVQNVHSIVDSSIVLKEYFNWRFDY